MINATAVPIYLYVSPVEGHVVSRFGSATRTTNNAPIGYVRNAETGCFDIIDPQIVVRIPLAEYQRFQREYDLAIDVEKSLVRRNEADFKAWQALLDERAEEATKPATAADGAKKTASAPPA